MRVSRIAVVGSGIVGTTVALELARHGCEVHVLEKGPVYPYPHAKQFTEQTINLYKNPAYQLPADIKHLTTTGEYSGDRLDRERVMVIGGSATRWSALTMRMLPVDFRTKSLFGFGNDWPLSYDELEPYYGRAEALLGVSGTDDDNPFASPRSAPYPLPPFPLSYDDQILAGRLKEAGILLHTTPQARTSAVYQNRAACINHGTCHVCPIGARYSPNHHLMEAQATGNCLVTSDVSVRRILTDAAGRATGVMYRQNAGSRDEVLDADVVLVAAGAIESTRLLLLSTSQQHPDGLGNRAGVLGKDFTLHHIWGGRLAYKEKLYPGRFGGYTGQSHQFLNPPQRGKVGGIKVEFMTRAVTPRIEDWSSAGQVIAQLEPRLHGRIFAAHAETSPGDGKYIALSTEKDRFGDPFAHVHYESSPFDHDTHGFAKEIYDRFAAATGAEPVGLGTVTSYESGAHHMGGCRMGSIEKESVLNPFGEVYGAPNVFVGGGACFPGCSGAVNPTLTMVALAYRTSDLIRSRLT